MCVPSTTEHATPGMIFYVMFFWRESQPYVVYSSISTRLCDLVEGRAVHQLGSLCFSNGRFSLFFLSTWWNSHSSNLYSMSDRKLLRQEVVGFTESWFKTVTHGVNAQNININLFTTMIFESLVWLRFDCDVAKDRNFCAAASFAPAGSHLVCLPRCSRHFCAAEEWWKLTPRDSDLWHS